MIAPWPRSTMPPNAARVRLTTALVLTRTISSATSGGNVANGM
jgi:hypothetical protein